jgi:hypothetical protein
LSFHEEELRKTFSAETLRILEKQKKDLEIWLEEELAKLKQKGVEK